MIKTKLMLWVLLVCLLAGSPVEAQAAPSRKPNSEHYLNWAIGECSIVRRSMPAFTRVAEIIAQRHIAGGQIGFVGTGQALPSELQGRAGGMMNTGFGNSWSKDRTPEQKAQNVAICGWEHAPLPRDLEEIKRLKAAGTYVVGFGKVETYTERDIAAVSDAWFVPQPFAPVNRRGATIESVWRPVESVGRPAPFMNMLQAWVLVAETVGALTRQGKMPPMFFSYMVPGSRDWSLKYRNKVQFHDDLQIPPLPAGQLGTAYVDEIERNLKRLRFPLGAKLPIVAKRIVGQLARGQKTPIAYIGHAPGSYLGRDEDEKWAQPVPMETPNLYTSTRYMRATPNGAFVVRLGYTGLDRLFAEAFELKQQDVFLITTPNPDGDKQIPKGMQVLDMGWNYGDAAVTVPGYPAKILPPSGVIQAVIYEALSLEVADQLKHGEPSLLY